MDSIQKWYSFMPEMVQFYARNGILLCQNWYSFMPEVVY